MQFFEVASSTLPSLFAVFRTMPTTVEYIHMITSAPLRLSVPLPLCCPLQVLLVLSPILLGSPSTPANITQNTSIK